jgi:hypothetical protein
MGEGVFIINYILDKLQESMRNIYLHSLQFVMDNAAPPGGPVAMALG